MPADKPPREAPLSLRLRPEVLDRVERVRAAVEQAAGLAPAVVPTRHGVLLAAILAGLDSLEARYGIGAPPGVRRPKGRRSAP